MRTHRSHGEKSPVAGNSRRNLMRIDWAIRDASVALSEDTGLPWALSRDWNYQMSNRFAWAWKLTDLGIPVIVVYLGFLKADEISDLGKPFTDSMDWQNVVTRHSQARPACRRVTRRRRRFRMARSIKTLRLRCPPLPRSFKTNKLSCSCSWSRSLVSGSNESDWSYPLL